MTIKELSLAAEREVILSLRGATALGYGSSRVTYDLSPKLVASLGLDPSRDYVVKLAVGRGGLNQMDFEVGIFKSRGESGCLAIIPASGQFCEIMEKVIVIDDLECDTYDTYDDFVCCGLNGYDDEDTNDNYSDEQKQEMWRAHEFLNEEIGYSSDNCQLGITSSGHAVAFDYGFLPDSDDEQMSSSSYRVAQDTGDYYIGRIAQLIDEALTEGQEHIEPGFLSDFMGSIDEEMSDY